MAILRMRRAARSSVADDPVPPITAAELAAEIGADATRAGHLLASAWALVQRYGPAAPDAIKREAIIRCSGWLHEQPRAAVRSESTGDISTNFAPTHVSALRHSGAMALITPWKVRSAGVL